MAKQEDKTRLERVGIEDATQDPPTLRPLSRPMVYGNIPQGPTEIETPRVPEAFLEPSGEEVPLDPTRRSATPILPDEARLALQQSAGQPSPGTDSSSDARPATPIAARGETLSVFLESEAGSLGSVTPVLRPVPELLVTRAQSPALLPPRGPQGLNALSGSSGSTRRVTSGSDGSRGSADRSVERSLRAYAARRSLRGPVLLLTSAFLVVGGALAVDAIAPGPSRARSVELVPALQRIDLPSPPSPGLSMVLALAPPEPMRSATSPAISTPNPPVPSRRGRVAPSRGVTPKPVKPAAPVVAPAPPLPAIPIPKPPSADQPELLESLHPRKPVGTARVNIVVRRDRRALPVALFVDGVGVGQSPVVLDLPAGNHLIEARPDDGPKRSTSIELVEGKASRVVLDL